MVISLIVPVGARDAQHFIQHLLRIGGSDWPPEVEIVAIFDGPSASTASQGIAERDFQGLDVILLSTIREGGPGSARNLGLNACSGKYVAFVDADDHWRPKSYLEAAHLAESEDLDLVVGEATLNGRRWRSNWAKRALARLLPFPDSAFVDQVGIWRLCLRRSFLAQKSLSFPERSYGEDLVFSLRVLDCSPRSMRFKKLLYDYRPSSGGLASTADSVMARQCSRQVLECMRDGTRTATRVVAFEWFLRLALRAFRPARMS